MHMNFTRLIFNIIILAKIYFVIALKFSKSMLLYAKNVFNVSVSEATL